MLRLNSDIHRLALTLPRPRRRSEEMRDALLNGQNVIWAFPKTVDPSSVIRWMKESCAEEGYRVQEVDVRREVTDPVLLLADAILDSTKLETSKPDGRHDPVQLLVKKAPNVLVLRGIWDLDQTATHAWARLISRWTAHVQALFSDDVESKTFFIPTSDPSFADLVKYEPAMLHRSYWGWIGDVEMRVLARELAHARSVTVSQRRWLETSFVGVAGSDLDLLQWLVDHFETSGSVAGIVTHLAEYGRRRGWDVLLQDEPELFEQVNIGSPMWVDSADAPLQEPPVRGRRLWIEGLLDKDRYEGFCLHSAAAALQGSAHVIEHRMWRGQARTLLPVLDAVRLELCQYLTFRHPGWQSYKFEPNGSLSRGSSSESNGITKLDEFPAIVAFVDGLRKKHTSYRALFDAVKVLRDGRNQLAHYTPLNRQEFDQLWRAVETARIVARGE